MAEAVSSFLGTKKYRIALVWEKGEKGWKVLASNRLNGKRSALEMDRSLYNLVRAGTTLYELVQPCTSWYELLRAVTSCYELVRAGTSWYRLVCGCTGLYVVVRARTSR
jgi:hypothetical protein